jgi:hypothetical protein
MAADRALYMVSSVFDERSVSSSFRMFSSIVATFACSVRFRHLRMFITIVVTFASFGHLAGVHVHGKMVARPFVRVGVIAADLTTPLDMLR